MSERHVAHTKPLNRTQNLTESRERFSSNTGVSGDVLSKKRFWLLDSVLNAEARLIDQWSLSSAWCGTILLWDTSGCKFNGFIFLYVSKHATSLVTWIHTVCRAYETFYINEPPIATQLLEQALRLNLQEYSFRFNGKKRPSNTWFSHGQENGIRLFCSSTR